MCREVEKPVTGFFLGASNGKWQGEHGFRYSLAAYEFDFVSLKTNDEGFNAEIQKLKTNELSVIGAMQAKLGLHYNLLVWMHFASYFTVADKIQAFGFSAEPGNIHIC
jgi:hypothetical protein